VELSPINFLTALCLNGRFASLQRIGAILLGEAVDVAARGRIDQLRCLRDERVILLRLRRGPWRDRPRIEPSFIA
jgi:hypothetical protein